MKHGIIADLKAEDYFAANGVSKSMLDRLAKSPAHLQAYLSGEKKEPTKQMVLGTLMHLVVFQTHLFKEGKSHWLRPEGMSFTSKEGRAWKEARGDALPILDAAEFANLQGMSDALSRHPIARVVLQNGLPEVSVFAPHENTGVLRKGRLDWITRDKDGRSVIVDLKTTDDAMEFERKSAGFRYYVQNAYYVDLLKSHGYDDPFFMFLVIEREAPWGIRIVQYESEDVQSGRWEYERGLEQYARCAEKNEWPGYSQEIETIRLPAWAKNQRTS